MPTLVCTSWTASKYLWNGTTTMGNECTLMVLYSCCTVENMKHYSTLHFVRATKYKCRAFHTCMAASCRQVSASSCSSQSKMLASFLLFVLCEQDPPRVLYSQHKAQVWDLINLAACNNNISMSSRYYICFCLHTVCVYGGFFCFQQTPTLAGGRRLL